MPETGTKLLGGGRPLVRRPGAQCILTDTLPVPELPPDTAVYQVPADVMESLSPMKTPQGALFLCRLQPPAPLALTPGCLILDGIQDPGNLGTILRTADALEVPVVLTPGCAAPL